MNTLPTFFRQLDWGSPRGWATIFLLALLGVILISLIGPAPLIAYGLRYWAASSWDWKDRWASIRGLALFFRLFFCLICVLILIPLIHEIFHTFWVHSRPPGMFSLWPPLPQTLLARWLLPLLLTPAVALTLQWISPLTWPTLTHIFLPSDITQIRTQAKAAARQQAEAVQMAAAQVAREQADAQATIQKDLKRKRATKSLKPTTDIVAEDGQAFHHATTKTDH